MTREGVRFYEGQGRTGNSGTIVSAVPTTTCLPSCEDFGCFARFWREEEDGGGWREVVPEEEK